MAKVNNLKIGNLVIIESDGKIDWNKFKNTPPSIVRAVGHNHDTIHYRDLETNLIFYTYENKLVELQAKMDKLGFKTEGFIGGGGTNNNKIHNFTTLTDTNTNLGDLLSHSPLNSPGITSKNHGYIINKNKTTSKFSYTVKTSSDITPCPIEIGGSLINYAVQTKGFITDGNNMWAELDVVTNTWSLKDEALSTASNRPMLSSPTVGFTKTTGHNISYMYNYIKGISQGTISFNTNGSPTGLFRNSLMGYWISEISTNLKVNYLTQSVMQMPLFTTHFSSSNTVSTEFMGYVISGSNNTSVQKMTWSTESITQTTNVIDMTGASSIEF